MKIAIQGIGSSFHAKAANAMFGDNIDMHFCDTFAEVFDAVTNGLAEYGVTAIENSLYGSINETYDLLLSHHLHIIAETYQQIGLQLVGTPGSNLGTITDVYSQAPALSESDTFLNTHLPHAERHEYGDTATAAQYVSNSNDISKAAIASKEAANEFNLTILAENIETHHHNYTRFIALSLQPPAQRESNVKSSITFETSDTPGSLYAALGVFASNNINLTKLESRPVVGKVWHYMYYVDLEAEFTPALKKQLKEHAQTIRVLGMYPNNTLLPS